jgi:hypothetical protein
MADAADRQELLTALTTEHFTLQGARSQTMSESASRTMLYIGAVSSTLVALGFIGQVSEVGNAFDVFALTVLPTLYVLGAFTFIRVVECGAEDFRYGLAINRIRGYYRQLARDQADLFLLSGHDDGRGVFENMGLPVEGPVPAVQLRDSRGDHQQRRRRERDRDRSRGARRAAGRRGGDRRPCRDRVGAGVGAPGGTPAG